MGRLSLSAFQYFGISTVFGSVLKVNESTKEKKEWKKRKQERKKQFHSSLAQDYDPKEDNFSKKERSVMF